MDARLELGAGRDGPRHARRWLSALLADAGADAQTIERAAIVVSELVTNSVVHARSPVLVCLEPGEPIVIEVADQSPAPPRVVPDPVVGTSGRGMRLVEALSKRWGVQEVPGDGKIVWAEL